MSVTFKKRESELRNRKCRFHKVPARLMVSIPSDPELQAQYVPLETQESNIQCAPKMAQHEVNTETIDFASVGMCHVEGGWPKDVSATEEDHKVRYRKKVEKDDTYIHAMLQLGTKIEHCIRQNNAIDIYEMYFEEDSTALEEDPEPIKTVNVIRDTHGGKRMATGISFSPEGGEKIAVAYSSSRFLGLRENTPKDSYVWDISSPSQKAILLLDKAWNQVSATTIQTGLFRRLGAWGGGGGGNQLIDHTKRIHINAHSII
ncbi:unnamed protein product, partial [Meganyctiphanes norvegica]